MPVKHLGKVNGREDSEAFHIARSRCGRRHILVEEEPLIMTVGQCSLSIADHLLSQSTCRRKVHFREGRHLRRLRVLKAT